MSKNIKSEKGVISIFVALMMAGILSLGTFALEAGRYQAAKTQLSEATISASSSMLAAYNIDLYERFGLFAIDENRSNEISCRKYMEFNSDLASGYLGNNATRLYDVEDVSMKGMYNLTYPHILKRQLLTVAKYNLAPENSELNKYNATYVLDELQMKCDYISVFMDKVLTKATTGNLNDISPEMRAALLALDQTYVNLKKYDEKHNVELTSDTRSLLPSVTRTVKSDVSSADANNVNAVINDAHSYLGTTADALNFTSAEVKEKDVSINLTILNELNAYHRYSWNDALTQTEVVENAYVGGLATLYKALADNINACITNLESDIDSNLLLNSYISQMFSNRRYEVDEYVGPGFETSESKKENMTFAKACCEYIFGGYVKETDNQTAAYNYVMALRLIGNLYKTLIQSNSFNTPDAYSNSIQNRYTVAAHFAWAYYETCVDMELLTEYNTAVPLTKDSLILNINDPVKVKGAFLKKKTADALKELGYYNEVDEIFEISGVDSLNYTDSLSLGLWFVPNSEKLLRVADLIQLEMRYEQQYVDGVTATFLMSEQNTYCRVECSAKMNSILPVISIGGADHSFQGQNLNCVKYAGY